MCMGGCGGSQPQPVTQPLTKPSSVNKEKFILGNSYPFGKPKITVKKSS